MDEREKIEQRERHERFMRKHFRTREEQKAIEESARARRASRRERGARRRRFGCDDEALEALEALEDSEVFEKISRGPRARGGEGSRPLGATAGGPSRPGAPGTAADPAPGALVVAVHRDRVRVRRKGGAEEDLRIAPGDPALCGSSRPVVGDRVRLAGLADGTARVASIEARRTVLSRPDPSDPRRERVLAANVDRALVVASARSPAFRPGLVERVLLALSRGGVAPQVCVNKIDLLASAPEREVLEQQLDPWRSRGISCHLVSAGSGEGLAELAAAIRGTTCVLVGHSGVGKSSLLNALAPFLGRSADLALPTGAVRRGDGKGRHTTSASQLFELARGTRVIDTPGIRAFGLWDVGRAELDAAFPDVTALPRCRFGDCTHGGEPGCSARAAVAGGELSADRLDTYRRLALEVADR